MSLTHKRKKAKANKMRPRRVTREPAKKLAAKLDPEELDQLLQAEELLDDMRLRHGLMGRGYQSLWVEIRKKYSINGEVDLDKKTGEIFYRTESTLPKVH